ncbi:MAG: methylmalonyl-CoA mutase family protein [Xanthobacteraceae bacterium]
MTGPETLPLGGDFPTATQDEWRKLVDAVLKGAPFERLTSRTHDGLTIEPLYARARNARAVAGRPGGTAWTVMQRVDHPDPATANVQALEDLNNGATGLLLVLAGSISANGFGLDGSALTLERVLDGVDLGGGLVVDLNLSPSTRGAARDLAKLIKRRGTDPASVDVRLSVNPIGGFAATGKSPRNWKELAPAFAAMIGEFAGDGFRGPFAVADGRIIHNAGGSEAQELAFALASAVAYFRAFEESGMPLDRAYDAIYFRLSADADQFLTTAKFRAMRKLWARVGAASGISPDKAIVTAETAWRMMTRRDPYGNILRNTIAVVAAGLGGADAITVLPHTVALGLPDAFARRIARNTQLVLLDESNLARVGDPAAGSGAFEALTEQLCRAAWAQFQEIESAGGAWAALESGLIARNVAAVRAAREKAVARGADILTGTNAFPDPDETPPAVLAVPPRDVADDTPAQATAEPLPRLRLAEPFERLRDRSDTILAATGARPKIFLAVLGTPAEFTARANFARSFFEGGGIEAVTADGFESRTQMIAALKRSGARLACLCSSDEVYAREAVEAAKTLAPLTKHLYLAGRPKDHALLKEAGVGTFIHAGCDAIETLAAAYQALA